MAPLGREIVARLAAAAGRPVPQSLAAYAARVRASSASISDAEVRALREAGCTEDGIFEVTVGAAVGAGLDRLRTGLAALRGKA